MKSDHAAKKLNLGLLVARNADGTAKVEGDITILAILAKLAKTMVDFDPNFEILPGTKRRPATPVESDPYEAVPGAVIPE